MYGEKVVLMIKNLTWGHLTYYKQVSASVFQFRSLRIGRNTRNLSEDSGPYFPGRFSEYGWVRRGSFS